MFGAKRRNYTDSAYLIVGKKKVKLSLSFLYIASMMINVLFDQPPSHNKHCFEQSCFEFGQAIWRSRNAKHPALQRWLAFKRFGNANFGIAELEPIGLAMPWIPKLGASLSIEEGFATLRSATDCHIWDISVICLIIWECLSRLPRGALELLWKRA